MAIETPISVVAKTMHPCLRVSERPRRRQEVTTVIKRCAEEMTTEGLQVDVAPAVSIVGERFHLGDVQLTAHLRYASLRTLLHLN